MLKDRTHSKRSGSGDTATIRNAGSKENAPNGWGLHIELPRSPSRPFTLSHTQTPGWDTPWTARLPTSIMRQNGNGDACNQSEMEEHQPKEEDKQTPWQQRKKMLRGFLLTNSYVPLVSARIPIFHMNKTQKRATLPAIPVCKYHPHHQCIGHCDTNTSVGDEPSCQGCCG